VDRVREWAALIGRRNIAYVVFVSLLVPFGMLMEAAGPQGPDAGGGIMAAIILWSVARKVCADLRQSASVKPSLLARSQNSICAASSSV
jgi:hypothetical protein